MRAESMAQRRTGLDLYLDPAFPFWRVPRGQDFKILQPNLRGLAWWVETVPVVKPFLTAAQTELIDTEGYTSADIYNEMSTLAESLDAPVKNLNKAVATVRGVAKLRFAA